MTVIVVFFLGVSVIFLLRTVLIFMGYLKAPIIHTFEKYGPHEELYLPLLPLMLWSGIFMVALGAVVIPRFGFVCTLVGLALLCSTGLGYQNYQEFARFHYRWLPFPRWFHELVGRTTRYERRRIAYRWLLLPRRTRLAYSSDDRMFLQWADFVIMATIHDQEDDFKQPVREEERYPQFWG
jgi:hypothetical protein